VALVRTDVLKKRIASMIRVKGINSQHGVTSQKTGGIPHSLRCENLKSYIIEPISVRSLTDLSAFREADSDVQGRDMQQTNKDHLNTVQGPVKGRLLSLLGQCICTGADIAITRIEDNRTTTIAVAITLLMHDSELSGVQDV
jgi:hypothetical protein